MKSLDRRLNQLETRVVASKLHVIVVRRGETTAQARSRMGSPGFVVFIPEKDATDQTQGVQT